MQAGQANEYTCAMLTKCRMEAPEYAERVESP